VQARRERLARLTAIHHRRDDRVATCPFAVRLGRTLEVLRNSGREHLDVTQFLGGGLHQQRPELLFLRGDGERLEHVLEGHAHLALGTADGLLEHLRELRVGLLDSHFVLEFRAVMEHATGTTAGRSVTVGHENASSASRVFRGGRTVIERVFSRGPRITWLPNVYNWLQQTIRLRSL